MTTFAEFAQVVLEERDLAGIRGIDSERSRYSLHIAPAAFASMPLAEIRARHIREWLREMSQKDAADTRGIRKICDQTTKRSLALVSSIATAAHEREEIEVNFCTGVKVKKRADGRETKDKWTFLTLDEQIAVAKCDAIPYMDRLAIRFAIATGLRQGEQCNLLLADLHTGFDSPRVVVRHGSFKPKRGGMLPPKSGKIRTVPLFGDGIVCAREWCYARADAKAAWRDMVGEAYRKQFVDYRTLWTPAQTERLVEGVREDLAAEFGDPVEWEPGLASFTAAAEWKETRPQKRSEREVALAEDEVSLYDPPMEITPELRSALSSLSEVA